MGTYQESIQNMPCIRLEQENSALWTKSQPTNGNLQEATGCCSGGLKGDCGNGLKDAKNFIKRNAANNKDGGLYAAKTFTEQRYMTLYNCPSACLNLQQADAGNQALAKPVTKTAKATCVGFLAGSLGCVLQEPAGDSLDCSGCTGIFNNVAPQRYVRKFKTGPAAIPNLNDLRARIVQ